MDDIFLSDDIVAEAIKKARIAKNNAFTLNLRFPVGASVVTYTDKIYSGCSVETFISGLGTCAERSAINNAISNGEYKFKAVVVAFNRPTFPCGVCLQYISTFYQITGKDISIISIGDNDNKKISSLTQLLPEMYISTHNDALKKYS